MNNFYYGNYSNMLTKNIKNNLTFLLKRKKPETLTL